MQSQTVLAKAKGVLEMTIQVGGASMRRSLLRFLLKSQLHARRALSKRERGACPRLKTSMVRKGKAQKSGVALNKKKPKAVERGWGGRAKSEEHEGAGGACSRGSDVATAYGRRPGRLLKRLRHYLVLTSFRTDKTKRRR
eukprot:418946-Pleurochrysis_carterae.AAC.4